MRLARLGVVCAMLVPLAATPAIALDQPLSGKKLLLRRTVGGDEKLTFLSKDPALLLPAIGSPDDPASGTPGGVTIELFSHNEGGATFAIPVGTGWLVRAGSPALYKFVNKLAPGGPSPVASLLLKEGKAVRLRALSVGLPLASPQGTVGIRLTMGSRRLCALFDATTVRRDAAPVFLARDATASGIVDCSNTSLGGPTCAEQSDAPTCGGTCPPGSACGTRDLSTCECISAAQPCGDTSPVCNGECPVGEQCGSVGGFPLPGCGCVPAASTPCGDTMPTCGGACPATLSCYASWLYLPIGTFHFCECLDAPPPPDPCLDCQPWETCIGPPFFPTLGCYPTPCGGGGQCSGLGCPAGSSCQAIPLAGAGCACLP